MQVILNATVLYAFQAGFVFASVRDGERKYQTNPTEAAPTRTLHNHLFELANCRTCQINVVQHQRLDSSVCKGFDDADSERSVCWAVERVCSWVHVCGFKGSIQRSVERAIIHAVQCCAWYIIISVNNVAWWVKEKMLQPEMLHCKCEWKNSTNTQLITLADRSLACVTIS